MNAKDAGGKPPLGNRIVSNCVCAAGLCWIWGAGQKERVRAGFVRGGLWVFGLFIALLPATQASKASFSMDLESMASAANKAGFFS